jgi:hypothetical protein
MSTYRDAPRPEPLLLAFGNVLLAIDPTKGTLFWQLPLTEPAERMFRIGNRLMLIIGKRMLGVDVSTGEIATDVELEFSPTNGLVHESLLHLVGKSGAACIDADGRVLWMASQPAMTKTWSFDFSLQCTRGDGAELWKVDAGVLGQPAMCLGNQVAQPDHKG